MIAHIYDLPAYIWSSSKAWLLITIFANSFSFSSSLFFLGGKRKGGKKNHSRDFKLCLSARSFVRQDNILSPPHLGYNLTLIWWRCSPSRRPWIQSLSIKSYFRALVAILTDFLQAANYCNFRVKSTGIIIL